MIAGIDYGSKLAGTTAIAFVHNNAIRLQRSLKKKDADQFILSWVEKNQPKQLFIDAPLSLPAVYRDVDHYSDYFYRLADRQLKAMSPMFLGGLTARAMKLRASIQSFNIEAIEVYPGGLARHLKFPADKYKKDRSSIPEICQSLTSHFPSGVSLGQMPTNWHEVDALLCLISGWRYQKGAVISYGTPEEGQIYI